MRSALTPTISHSVSGLMLASTHCLYVGKSVAAIKCFTCGCIEEKGGNKRNIGNELYFK